MNALTNLKILTKFLTLNYYSTLMQKSLKLNCENVIKGLIQEFCERSILIPQNDYFVASGILGRKEVLRGSKRPLFWRND